jgi:class 3 adenylate cyclase/tetratricopeptide (TPR) repeat protein
MSDPGRSDSRIYDVMRTVEEERRPVPQASLICEGEYWTLAFKDRVIRLRDSKGLRQLALLLRTPRREFHVLDFGPRVDPWEFNSNALRIDPEELAKLTVQSSVSRDSGDLLDARALAAYKQRRAELTEELEDVREFQDQERVARIEDEIDMIDGVLKGALGLRGRSRKAGSAAEKARVNITKNIGRALDRIEAKHESLGRLLKSTIKTGIFCSYQPDPRFPVAWSFEGEESAQTISSTEPDQRSLGSAPDLHRGPAQSAGREARRSEWLGAPPKPIQHQYPGHAAPATAMRSDDLQIRAPETPAPENVEGERKTITALFADFKGSMGINEDLDSEEVRAIVDPALKLMIDAVHHYDGYVSRSTDDGIFALFGAPVAHEDHPQRALSVALRMKAEVKRYAEKLRAEKGLNMHVRVGINTGEVVVREIRMGEKHTEYGPMGHPISVAANVQMLLAPGSIAITESVRKLVEGFVTVKSLGRAQIKGGSELHEIYEVTGPGPLRSRFQRAAARGYTRFVGRRREMEMLKNAAESAKMGRGQIVASVAEPGVGKSRLLFEFKATSQNEWLVLEGVSFSHGKTTAYLPVIELLHDYFGIKPDDEPLQRREKVASKARTLDRSLEETLPHLFGLLGIVEGTDPLAGMDEQIRRRRTQEAVKRILVRESLNRPLMLIFEDLHLIDDATQGVLNLLAEGIASASVLLLVNYRPEYTHQWSSKTYYTHLRLDPLAKESADEMLSARIGDSPDLAPVKRLILERTEGNPLFIEEVVEALFDEGVLVRNGGVKVTRPLSELKIPPVIQGILAARIDRLSPHAKELLQTLAVIGSQFPLELVRQVVQLPDDRLDPLLDVLQAGEFIYERPARGDIEYTFKHALTREVTYASILSERRKALHAQIGMAIERLNSARLEDQVPVLAHHFREAADAERAIQYSRRAGEQAAVRGVYRSAIAHFRAALEILKASPETDGSGRTELEILMALGPALMTVNGQGSDSARAVYKRAVELTQRDSPSAAHFQAVYCLWVVKHTSDLAEARDLVPLLFEEAQQLDNATYVADSYCATGVTLFWLGDFVSAREQLERGVELSAGSGEELRMLNNDLRVSTRLYLANDLWFLGFPDQALALADKAMTLAQSSEHYNTVASAMVQSIFLRVWRRETSAVVQQVAHAVAYRKEHGLSWLQVALAPCFGWALVQQGKFEDGIAALCDGMAAWKGAGTAMCAMWFASWLSDAYRQAGRFDEGLAATDEALKLIQRSGERNAEGELYRVKGELLRTDEQPDQAEVCFRKAIEIAHSQKAKSWELRATTGLARLLRDTNRRSQARATLAGIYYSFAEGFDTADLKEAKGLLDELSS